jgi:hypothetical protein
VNLADRPAWTTASQDAYNMLQMALAVQCKLRTSGLSALPNKTIAMRIGLHTGPVIGGIIGIKCPRYQLFGPNVDLVMAIEPAADPTGVVVSAAFYTLFCKRYTHNSKPHWRARIESAANRAALIDSTEHYLRQPASPAGCSDVTVCTTGSNLDGTIRHYLEEEAHGTLGVFKVQREILSPLRRELLSSPPGRRLG